MKMKNFFKRGNTKIDKSVLTFTLPTRECFGEGNQCKGCYARFPERIFPTVLKHRIKSLEYTATADFVPEAIEMIIASGCKVIRLHESGDFYSALYVEKWIKIAQFLPYHTFYTMTKKRDKFPEEIAHFACLHNVNVIDSTTEDGGLNYGSWDRMFELQKKGYFLCPCADKDFHGCGVTCKMCENTQKVCFLEHSGATRPAERRKNGEPKREKPYYNF